MLYGLIMAGGTGTRLWPKSRINSPKQLHSLVSEKSMLSETVDRIKPLIPKRNIWIVTNKNYLSRVIMPAETLSSQVSEFAAR